MNYCKNCEHSADYGESVKYIYCERNKKRKTVEKDYTCKNYVTDTNVGKMESEGE